MRIVCSGHLIRYPIGGHTWHHLQYLVGLRDLGHDVTYFEDFGWHGSCYDPSRDVDSSDPAYGLAYWADVMQAVGLAWDVQPVPKRIYDEARVAKAQRAAHKVPSIVEARLPLVLAEEPE